jgi:hypothetical protein
VNPTPELLARCRRQAHRLRRCLRDPDPELRAAAAARLLALPEFAGASAAELLADSARVRLRHALAVVALDHGFGSWSALQAACEAAWLAPTAMYAPAMAAYLNVWFADYEEARAHRLAEGGYLLPYRDHFLVVEPEAIRELGLDPDDPDWARIGYDFARPRDAAAHARLVARRKRAMTG